MRQHRQARGHASLRALALTCLWAAACRPAPHPGEPNAAGVSTSAVVVDGQPAESDPVLVRLGERQMTLSEYERRVDLMPRAARIQATAARDTDAFEKLLWLELLAGLAASEGHTASVDEAILVRDAAARATLREQAAAAVARADVTDDDVARAWEARRQADFQRPGRARAWALFFTSRDDAETARRLAATRIRRLDAHEVIAGLSETYPQAALTPAGDLGWLDQSDPTLDPALRDAVFETTRGGVRPLVQTSRGWAVVSVGRVVPPLDVTLDEATPLLRDELTAARRGEAARRQLDAWRAARGAEIDAAAVARLEAARVDPAAGGASDRPRRYAAAALADDPAAFLGEGLVEEAFALAFARGNLPVLQIDPSVAPADGRAAAAAPSPAPADGSAAAAAPALPPAPP